MNGRPALRGFALEVVLERVPRLMGHVDLVPSPLS
jgi:hypothetical protein